MKLLGWDDHFTAYGDIGTFGVIMEKTSPIISPLLAPGFGLYSAVNEYSLSIKYSIIRL